MLDATLNITPENSPILTVISQLQESEFERSIHSSFEQFTSLLSNSEISALAERIKASQLLTPEIPTIFTQFAHWMARLQTNNALACDFDEPVEVEPLLIIPTSGNNNPTTENKTHQYTYSKDLLLNYAGNTIDPTRIGDAIVGIATEDSLLYDS